MRRSGRRRFARCCCSARETPSPRATIFLLSPGWPPPLILQWPPPHRLVLRFIHALRDGHEAPRGRRARALRSASASPCCCIATRWSSPGNARLAAPFVSLALVPEAASSLLLVERIGYSRAFAMFALGQTLTGATAAEYGIATAAVDAGDVRAEALAIAMRLAALPPTGSARDEAAVAPAGGHAGADRARKRRVSAAAPFGRSARGVHRTRRAADAGFRQTCTGSRQKTADTAASSTRPWGKTLPQARCFEMRRAPPVGFIALSTLAIVPLSSFHADFLARRNRPDPV